MEIAVDVNLTISFRGRGGFEDKYVCQCIPSSIAWDLYKKKYEGHIVGANVSLLTLETNKNVVLCSYSFGLWNGAFSADQSCIEGLQWECRNYDLLPDDFQALKMNLKSCSELEEKKKCLMEFLNGCGSNNYDDLEMARSDLLE
ncbi:hypothetical protein CEXT_761111 [Caerostris extrusa]|uniref:Uncharacterized protein n=1 Tax=Caerostris extrusa TaxID=172846 RepID=A0AAV4RFU3_CAEEX|nr:hypothetical protein CEXT_761111 [Caerostris extrusa]